MSIRKIILFLEVLICVVAVIFAFFYGTIYSESIQKNIPFFFGRDTETLIDESEMMEMEVEDGKKKDIEDEIDDFFKDEGTTGDDLDTLTTENGDVVPLEDEMEPTIPPIPTTDELDVEETRKQIQEPVEQIEQDVEDVEQKGIEMMKIPESSETINASEQPILIPEEQMKQNDVGEIQQIQESDVAIPSDAEEVQIEIGNEPVKIEGVQGIESEEIDLEDLEEMQQQEIDVDSDLIEL